MKNVILRLTGCILMGLGLVAQAQPLQVVTEATPYSYLQGDQLAGPATEVVRAALQRAGLDDYRAGLYPWARAYDLALKEPNVLIYLIARTPAREAQFKWAGEFMKMEYHLYKLRDRQDVAVRRLEDARRYSVGVIRDDLRHQYLRGKGFGKLVVSAQNIDNFRKLLARQIQLIPLPDADAAQLCREAQFDCAQLEKVLTLDELSTGLYMAFSHATDDATVRRVRQSFDGLKAEGMVQRLMEQVGR
jgi:polar amino acid transport system substrate-binding protein